MASARSCIDRTMLSIPLIAPELGGPRVAIASVMGSSSATLMRSLRHAPLADLVQLVGNPLERDCDGSSEHFERTDLADERALGSMNRKGSGGGSAKPSLAALTCCQSPRLTLVIPVAVRPCRPA